MFSGNVFVLHCAVGECLFYSVHGIIKDACTSMCGVGHRRMLDQPPISRQLLACESNSSVKILSGEDLVCRRVLNVSGSSGRCAAVWKHNDVSCMRQLRT